MSNESPAAHVDWSYSTAKLYRSCPRRFYYNYGKRGGSEDSDDWTDSKPTFQPVGARIGSVVHDCIAEKIQSQLNDSEHTLQDSQRSASDSLQRYVQVNEKKLQETHRSDDVQFTRDEFTESLIKTANHHLKTFFQVIWPQFASHRYILHEETANFGVGRHSIYVRPDYCTRSQEGDFIVTDWKTGGIDRFNQPSLQQLVYALWAHEQYEPDLSRIVVQLFHTKRGEPDRMRPDEDEIERIRSVIRADRKDWNTFQSIEDFQPTPEAGMCEACEYLSICEAGQSCLDKQR